MGHSHSITDNPRQLTSIVALAAAVGAVTAMLFTPRSGPQVRNGLRRRAGHLRDEMHDRASRASEEIADTAENAKDRLQSTAAKVADDAKATATDAKAAADEAKKPRRRSS